LSNTAWLIQCAGTLSDFLTYLKDTKMKQAKKRALPSSHNLLPKALRAGVMSKQFRAQVRTATAFLRCKDMSFPKHFNRRVYRTAENFLPHVPRAMTPPIYARYTMRLTRFY
jgi:hypothetical protein